MLSEKVPARTFELEVYDKYEKEYVQFEECTVEVQHPDVVEGCICTCVLADEKSCSWTFQRIRYDVLRPAYKRDVTTLLEHCIISKAKLLHWLVHDKIVPQTPNEIPIMPPLPPPPPPPPPLTASGFAASKTPTQHPVGLPTYATALRMQQGNAQPHAAMRMTPPLSEIMAPGAALPLSGLHMRDSQIQGTSSPVPTAPFSNVHGPLHVPAEPTTATPNPSTTTTDANALTTLQLLSTMVSSVHIVRTNEKDGQNKSASRANHRRHQQQGNDVRGLSDAHEKHDADKRVDNNRASRQDGKKSAPAADHCAQCLKKKHSEDLRLDKRDNKYYCYSCWAKLGWEFCRECGEFNKGYRERTRRHVGEFYCNTCWSSFNKEGEEATRKDSQVSASPNGQKQQNQRQRKQKRQQVEEDGVAVEETAEKKTKKRRPTERKSSRKSPNDEERVIDAAAEGEENMNTSLSNKLNLSERVNEGQANPKRKRNRKSVVEAETPCEVHQNMIETAPQAPQEVVVPNQVDVVVE
ncbi:hypothetical protein TRSC58_06236 [Trypanosoma rangeli SC58]|uniref:Uncharacterized protein n=1 Tax=Trypanosoma rangeli SC58 TaxID=429131 RepID=A0A061IVL0_TRYRA|nr:hypothetical protein TRSC58_06236 [Trypanosoma rangeli SC58]